MLTPDQKTISGLSFPLSHNLDSLSQLIINVVSAIFNGDYTTTTLAGDHSDRLTCLASQRKEKRVQILVIGFNARNDIFLAFRGIQ